MAQKICNVHFNVYFFGGIIWPSKYIRFITHVIHQTFKVLNVSMFHLGYETLTICEVRMLRTVFISFLIGNISDTNF